MGRINVTSSIFAEPWGSNACGWGGGALAPCRRHTTTTELLVTSTLSAHHTSSRRLRASVLISVTTDMSPTGDLLVTTIFHWGDIYLSLLRESHVLYWHCTKPGAAHP